MKNTALHELHALLPTLTSPEDFATWDEMAAELEIEEAGSRRFLLRTLGEVAEFFGQALQTVKQWRMETPPMPGNEQAYPLREIVRWRINKVLQSDLAAAKRQQDYDLGQILREQKQIELDREKGLILDRDDVELWAAQLIIIARETLMQLPEMIAASAPQELKELFRSETDRHCRDILEATARRLELAEIGKGGEAE